MGIRGLTTFIQNRSHLYLEDYELHDTELVIDGNSIACQLYKWHASSNDCFGGDYDKFGKAINNFFEVLKQCNITPFVIFDGGYETRKVATIISRMKNKIKSANQLNPVTETSVSVFPIFLRKTFENFVNQRGINKVRCDFEGDTDTANIARALGCPILSYDSDYFIFDTLYIPFPNFEMTVRRTKLQNNKTYKYINCKIYSVDKFLKSFDGLEKRSLPMLAVLLGNDYVKRGVFTMFYQNLKIQKCHGNQSDQQKRIKSLLIWLQNETIESALKKVLSRYKKVRRNNIMKKIQEAIKGYNSLDSKYLNYFDVIPILKDKSPKTDLDLSIVNNIHDEEEGSSSEEEKGYSSGEKEEINNDGSSSEEELVFEESSSEVDVPPKFLEKFRKCIYPPSFMDISVQNKYYCVPQIENNSLEQSTMISFDILSAIHKILTNSDDRPLLCIGRKGSEHVGKSQIPLCNIPVPSYNEIETLSKESKENLILDILDIDNTFCSCLKMFPQSWHIFLLTIHYYLKKTLAGWPIIYSLIMSKLLLSYVDKKVGFYRSSKIFNKRFASFTSNQKTESLNTDDIQTSLENISQNDSIGCLKAVITYFEMDDKLTRNYKAFDRNLVHSNSQFQSCLLHIGHLNILLDFPYSDFYMPDLLNSTFVYNLTNNLNKRTNLDEYMKILLKDAPGVLYSFQCILDTLRSYIKIEMTQQIAIKKRKKKKRKAKLEEEFENIQFDSDEEVVFDPNNKFAVLGQS